MQRPKLSLSKPKKVILILVLINVVAFSTTQTIAEKYTPSQIAKEDSKDLDYIEKGWQIVNWSYNLIKYFKKPHTA